MTCKNCGNNVSDNVPYCPFCGKKMQADKEKENIRNLIIIVSGVVIMLAISVFVLASVLNNAKIENSYKNNYVVVDHGDSGKVTPIVPEEKPQIISPEVEEKPPVSEEEEIIHDPYIFPDSDKRYIRESELSDRTLHELGYIRNEIYARHGYEFSNKEYKEYFESRSWYKVNKNFKESDLNKYEKANVALIKSIEKEIEFTPDYSDNEHYIYPTSNSEYMYLSDIEGKTKTEIAFIRNEIYARRGYIFKKEPYKTYFNSKEWYKANKYFSVSDFNAYEKANISLIEEYEKSMGWR